MLIKCNKIIMDECVCVGGGVARALIGTKNKQHILTVKQIKS